MSRSLASPGPLPVFAHCSASFPCPASISSSVPYRLCPRLLSALFLGPCSLFRPISSHSLSSHASSLAIPFCLRASPFHVLSLTRSVSRRPHPSLHAVSHFSVRRPLFISSPHPSRCLFHQLYHTFVFTPRGYHTLSLPADTAKRARNSI